MCADPLGFHPLPRVLAGKIRPMSITDELSDFSFSEFEAILNGKAHPAFVSAESLERTTAYMRERSLVFPRAVLRCRNVKPPHKPPPQIPPHPTFPSTTMMKTGKRRFHP